MKNLKSFPFHRARLITKRETEQFRRAIEAITRQKRAPRGRPVKSATEKYRAISIRIHPKILNWARRKAKKAGVGYQTIINDELLKKAV